ncbi:MAG TPA: hypothetical protein VHY91_14285 [Pirellulales bacterium]|jgi:hypothetical protein|nr:hypothetical protein [Pirellulales bacterium]
MNQPLRHRATNDSDVEIRPRTGASIALRGTTAASLPIVFGLAALMMCLAVQSPSAASEDVANPARPADVVPAAAAANPTDLTLQQLETERDVLQKSLMSVNEEIDKQLHEFDKLDIDTADLTNQESQLEDLKAIIRRVGTQLSLWNLELEAEQRIKVVDVASLPRGDDSVMRDVGIAVAGIVGFCAAFTVVGGIMLLFSRSPRRWKAALGAGILVGGLAAFALAALVPVHYEAQALIWVGKIQPVLLQNVMNGGVDERPEAYDVYKKTQLQLVKSPFALGRAARRSEMQKLVTMQEHKDDPVGFLESKLIVDYPGDGELMRVAMKGTRRDELPVIVNSIVDSYIDEIVSGDKVARLKQKDLLAQNYSTNQEKFRQQSDKFRKLARELGAGSSESARLRKKIAEQRLDATVASANALRQRIRDVELQISLLKERKAKTADGASGRAEPAPSIEAK